MDRLFEDFDELLGMAAQGNRAAMTHIYQALSGKLQGYLAAQGYSDPEGGVNDVFVKAIPGLPKFEGGEAKFRSWVFTIAHHMIIDERRRRSRRPIETSLGETTEAVGGDVEAESMAALGDGWVVDVLATLPDSQRTVVLLRIIGDLTVEQVAKTIGKSPGAVKALQRRAFTALQKKVSFEGVPL